MLLLACGPLEGHADSVLFVCYSPDGQYIISGLIDNTIRVWDVYGLWDTESVWTLPMDIAQPLNLVEMTSSCGSHLHHIFPSNTPLLSSRVLVFCLSHRQTQKLDSEGGLLNWVPVQVCVPLFFCQPRGHPMFDRSVFIVRSISL